MTIDLREFNELSRKAAELMSETADVPSVLRNRLGEQHDLTHAAERMATSIETFVRELRSFDASSEPAVTDSYTNPY
ncbi:MAG TPA: hypothetical protein VME17_23975 [Bryobacteraceae bacterium]|nr:hypothetical protein [Bryobacteraceae bacterium]